MAFILLERGGFKQLNKAFVLILCPFILQVMFTKLSPIGEVTFLDVGQGDSIFIRLPFNQGNYLIDTGGVIRFATEKWKEREKTFDPGEDVIVPFLKSKGITSLDKLILTHGDADHAGSAHVLLEHVRIKELVVGATVDKNELERAIIDRAKK